jgi:hypothetical protein
VISWVSNQPSADAQTHECAQEKQKLKRNLVTRPTSLEMFRNPLIATYLKMGNYGRANERADRRVPPSGHPR